MKTSGAPRGDVHIRVDTDKIIGGCKLLGQMRDLIRRKHYSIRTEQATEFERNQVVIVRNGRAAKAKDLVALFPPVLVDPIRDQKARIKQLYTQDLATGLGEVRVSYALVRRYLSTARQWGWQNPLPGANVSCHLPRHLEADLDSIRSRRNEAVFLMFLANGQRVIGGGVTRMLWC